MFTVSESEAETIRRAFHDRGEWSAVVELRRLFPVFANNPEALRCVRAIAGWQPLPAPAAAPPKVTQLRRRKPAEPQP
ncbi:hypothetical protein Sp245p_17210 (plasmid) [Azospirillum baldaniorum]|uniref:Uncharacterized protein n=2 Tax=Azospirillum TaxID=191 RepID=A0A560CFD1_9PROT|nr:MULTISPECIES: hypothetical protein [Azospirillum]TWA83561.1 hypothetical protein FBZ85_101308 [Azospirillum brasilense]AIB14636.1 hypothetical protein ABAZ39_22300 [Azospirillum argentinense]AWJ91575.1 hypothetical protein Sp245p_17210 [Azospirillum baldaniorum]EZQ05182.1 hypothetical protein ABAZ39_15855 [Azospirillum argentinense]KAA1055928.1 hypothetical protein FH063_004903 [Azospirillum argentinense]